MSNELVTIYVDYELPSIIVSAGARTRKRVYEFFGASIRNDNTRVAYINACRMFFNFLDDHGIRALVDIEPIHVAAWLEYLKTLGPPIAPPKKRKPSSVASQKQYMAAVRMLFDYLVSGGLLAANPALSVRAPRQSVTRGKTPTLDSVECGHLLRSIEKDSLIGLRDRALIGVMTFTFARISAAVGLSIGDVFTQKKRLWLRLVEKGGKVHDMPCHHRLQDYLHDYMEAARLSGAAADTPLFQSVKRRTYGRGKEELSGRALRRDEAWRMVRARGLAAGLDTRVCNHTFRGTGITSYLENGGTLEKARNMAAHASTRTTQLYDRRSDDVTLDEVVKINIKG